MQPVLGGSLESLPDIVRRHKAMVPAFNKWRVSQLVMQADSFAEAMDDAAFLGLGDWANQEDVQRLLKEAFKDNGDAS